MKAKPFIAINIIPTGIGASIGGFAGDAGPSNRLIASCVDHLVANPNVVNAATLHNIPDNLIYTEGYTLDKFCKNELALRLKFNNKIGIVFDKEIPLDVLNININAINACCSVYGLNIVGYTITDKPVGVTFDTIDNQFSSGRIDNSHTLLSACKKMLDCGAETLAVVCFFHDDDDELYSSGSGIDPVGGVEAIISHLVSQEFNIICAHAPAFSFDSSKPHPEVVDPRAASEYFSPTFLPCVLAGLKYAPEVVSKEKQLPSDISIENITAIITPHNCLGSIPVLCCLEKNISIISVQNNSTSLDVTAQKLNINSEIVTLNNYLEVCGYLLALKQGINPEAILQPVQKTCSI